VDCRQPGSERYQVLTLGYLPCRERGHANWLPASAFGLPKQRRYPMEDRTHPIKAEEFATKEGHAGKLSPAQVARIRAKAKRPLGE
jgi:hypothetical protein